MKHLCSLITAIGLICCTPRAYSASPYTETFDSSLNGWFMVNVLGSTANWQWDAGTARLVFSLYSNPGNDFTESSLTATNTASSGSFVGSYFVAGFPVVGFDIIFETAVTSLLRLDFSSGSTNMQRAILPDQGSITTQQWYRVIIPLDSSQVQYWTFSTSSNDFDDVVDNVDKIAITIKRPNNSSHTCRVDNIFLTSIPGATAASLPGGDIGIVWQPLRDGATYRLETAETLPATWISNTTFAATNTTALTTFAPTTNTTFFRLQSDIIQAR